MVDALRSTWVSGGPYVERLEQEMAARLGIRHAIAVSSGTTAIELALRGLGIGRGDEVILPGFTFVAAANMVLALGATPVYADVDPDTWLLDPLEIARGATPATRAVLPVHLYGNVAEMDNIVEAAAEARIDVIEDSAEATFSSRSGRFAGTFGRAGTFSFHATKTITTGEGGMVVTGDDTLAERMRILRDHGMRRDRRYWHDVIGFNFRLTNLQAALGCAQLDQLDRIMDARRAIHTAYAERLAELPEVRLQRFDDTVDPVVWVTVIQLIDDRDPERVRERRDAIMAEMAGDGIETRPGFYDLATLPPYDAPVLPVSRHVSASTIALPTYVGLSIDDIERICASLGSHLRAG